MALNNLGLGFVFSAKDLASGAIANLEKNFTSLDKKVGLGTERIQSSFKAIGVGLSIFGAGVAGFGTALSLANAAGSFEQRLEAMRAAMGITSRELDTLREAALRAGTMTQFTPDEAIAGLESLTAAGQSAEQAARSLIPVLDLAAGSMGALGVTSAADTVVATLKAYGLAAEEAGTVSDRLLRITQLTSFQARDFDAALSKSAASSAMFGQSLDDLLVSMGAMRNRGIEATVAAAGLSEAVRRVGTDTQVQTALTAAGVQAFDRQTGKVRSIVDVMTEFGAATAGLSEQERNLRAATLFGTRGMQAWSAVMGATFTTMKDGAEVTLRGADAITARRGELASSQGTAARFRDELLNTFEGQKSLLRSLFSTLAVLAGEPFAAVFKPVVKVIATAVHSLVALLQSIPAPVKRVFAGIFLAASGALMLVGGFIAAKASIGLLLIGLKALGITLGGLLATILPAVLILGVLAAAVAGVALAFRGNLGGIADFARGLWDKVKLGFQGLVQLFEQGGFSGAVREELNRAENRGLKNFLINVFLWGNRIKNFFVGLAGGFMAGIDAARPTFETFVGELKKLGAALGFLSERDDAGTAAERFRSFGETGTRVGSFLAQAVELVVKALTAVVQVARGVAGAWEWIRAGGSVLMSALAQLGSKIAEVTNHLFGTTSAAVGNGDAWTALGNVIGFTGGFIVSLVGVLVSVISAAVAIISAAIEIVMAIFSGLADVITGVVFIIGGVINGSWTDIWTGMKLVAFGVVDAIIGVVLELAGAISGVVDAISGLFGEGTRWQQGIRDLRSSLRGDMAEGMGVQDLTFTRPTRPQPASVPGPALAITPMPAVAAMAPAMPASLPTSPAAPPASSPVVVHLQVDGQTLATAVHRADRDAATRSFSPVPAY